ncbi:hypothetical protein [Streptomyces sp. NPDC000410]
MEKQISTMPAAAFTITALIAGGATVTGGESTLHAWSINTHP